MESVDKVLLGRFMSLFPTITGKSAFLINADEISRNNGAKLKAIIDRRNVSFTEQNYLEHLGMTPPKAGDFPSFSINSIPLINSNVKNAPIDQTKWGLIDVDLYEEELVGLVSYQELTRQLTAYAPFVPVRSKSNGRHYYLFLSEKTPASRVISFLKSVKEKLNIEPEFKAKIEIYPKQEKLQPDENGSLINLPYYYSHSKKAYSTYAFSLRGLALTLSEFVNLAEKNKYSLDLTSDVSAISSDELTSHHIPPGEKLKKKKPVRYEPSQYDPEVMEVLRGPFGKYAGPPCFRTMMGTGSKISVNRNNRAYDIGVYLRRAWGSAPEQREEALEHGMKIIRRCFDMNYPSPFSPAEARSALASGYDGKKGFKCDEIQSLDYRGQPVCDPTITVKECMRCRHGIGYGRFSELHRLIPSFRRLTDNQTTRVVFRVRMMDLGGDLSDEIVMLHSDFIDIRKVVVAISNKTGSYFEVPPDDSGKPRRADDIWADFARDLNSQCVDVHQLSSQSYEDVIRPVIQNMIDTQRMLLIKKPRSYDPNIVFIENDSGKLKAYVTHEGLSNAVILTGGRAEEIRRFDNLAVAIDKLFERGTKEIQFASGESAEYYVCDMSKNKLFLRNRLLPAEEVRLKTDRFRDQEEQEPAENFPPPEERAEVRYQHLSYKDEVEQRGLEDFVRPPPELPPRSFRKP